MMKKLISLILALVMVLSMAVVASAETVEGNVTFEDSATSPEVEWTDENISTGKVYIKTSGDLTPVYSVDIAWEDLEFSYSFDTQVWDPDTHTYSGTSGGWVKDTIENAIKITNHSNSGIQYNATPVAENNTYNVNVTVSDNGTGSLATAVGTAENAAPFATMNVSVSGDPNDGGLTTDTFIYTVKLTISPAS